MDRCQFCGKNTNNNYMVTLTIKKGDPPQIICGDCFNKYMADMLGVEDYKDYKKEVTFTDCDGIEHCFQIRKQIYPTGIFWEAVEYIDVDKVGYSFKVHQDFKEDSKEALKKLYKKVKKGLSQKFIKREVFQGHELISFKGNTVKGRIEWDDRYDYRTPKFIIDGQEYSIEEFGRMIMTYEGWNFKLEIIEPTD